MYKFLILTILVLQFNSSVYANTNKPFKIQQLTNEEYKKYFNWFNNNNLQCKGYFNTDHLYKGIEQQSLNGTQQIILHAKKFNYQSKFLTAQDFYTLDGSQLLKSDNLEYDYEIKQSTISGNTYFSSENISFFSTQSIFLDYKSESLIAYNIFFSIPKNQIHGQAKKIEKNKNIIYLYDVEYTSCSPKTREWIFAAKKLTIDNTIKEANTKWVKLYVKSTPIFILPYLHFFLSDKRKSGFLYPNLSLSNHYGYNFNIPFYWNIKQNLDYTLNLNLYQKFDSVIESEIRHLDKSSSNKLYYLKSIDTLKLDEESIEVAAIFRSSKYFNSKLKGNLFYINSINPQRHILLDNYFKISQNYPIKRFYNLKYEDNFLLANIGKENWQFNQDLSQENTPYNLNYYLNFYYQNQIPNINLEYFINYDFQNLNRKNTTLFTQSDENNGALVENDRTLFKLKLLYYSYLSSIVDLNFELIQYTKDYNLIDYPIPNNSFKKTQNISSSAFDINKRFNFFSDNISIIKTRLKIVKSEKKDQNQHPIFYDDYQIVNYQTIFKDNLFFDNNRVENNSYSFGIEYLNSNQNRNYSISLGNRFFNEKRINYINDPTELNKANKYNAEPTTFNITYNHLNGLLLSNQTNYSFYDNAQYLSNFGIGYNKSNYSGNIFFENSKNYYASVEDITNNNDEQKIYGILFNLNYNEFFQYSFTQEYDFITKKKDESKHEIIFNSCCWSMNIEYINRTNLEKFKLQLNLKIQN